MKNRDSFIFYRSFYEAMIETPEKNQLEILHAICEFSLNFKEPELEGISSTIFKLIRPVLEANNKRYENGCKPKRKQKESKIKTNKDKEEDDDDDKEIMPTLDEFLNYCQTIPNINYPSLKFSFEAKYQSWADDGWKDGNGNKIKNWKTKIMNVIPHLKPMPEDDRSAGVQFLGY